MGRPSSRAGWMGWALALVGCVGLISEPGRLADGGTLPVTPPTPDAGAGPPLTGVPWLRTQGNHLVLPDGSVWHGRGANLHDTRSCDACAYSAPSVEEVKRRIDELTEGWKANFVRLNLESYGASGGRAQWLGPVGDPAYLADIQELVRYIGTKRGVRVLLSLWEHPGFTSLGWPTPATLEEWKVLARAFVDAPHVMFGLANEPQQNDDGSRDAEVWAAMNAQVAAIREIEDAAGKGRHIISVQGTGGWARRLDYYVAHPITAGGGENVVYEVHVYDAASSFAEMFERPARTLPVIIGEFGPTDFNGSTMTAQDCATLMVRAEALEVPYLAWTFHMRCPPNLLEDRSGGNCGVKMPLVPTAWGAQLKARLAQPY